jgi:hypothetical protein
VATSDNERVLRIRSVTPPSFLHSQNSMLDSHNIFPSSAVELLASLKFTILISNFYLPTFQVLPFDKQNHYQVNFLHRTGRALGGPPFPPFRGHRGPNCDDNHISSIHRLEWNATFDDIISMTNRWIKFGLVFFRG